MLWVQDRRVERDEPVKQTCRQTGSSIDSVKKLGLHEPKKHLGIANAKELVVDIMQLIGFWDTGLMTYV